jgi:hypothetical protein
MRRGRVLGLGIRITLSPNKRGDNVKSLYRDHETTLDILEEHRKGGDPVKFDQDGVCALYQPFWHNLPYCIRPCSSSMCFLTNDSKPVSVCSLVGG